MPDQLKTVVSWTNAEKRLYGTNHWFWGVWHVNGIPDYSWNKTEPSDSGFCKTKSEARTAAILNRGEVLQRNQWSLQYLTFKQEQDQRPLFSRIRSGRKWFWCVGWDLIDEPEFKGFASSAEAALEDAKRAAKREVQPSGNWMSRIALRQLRAEKIRQRQAQSRHARRYTQDAKSVSECFRVLGIDAGSGVAEVKSAYRKLALIHHPDLGGDAEQFIRIRRYYEQAMERLEL